MKELKVYVSDGNPQYLNFIKNYKVNRVSVIEDADLVLFTGGADVHPVLYSKEKAVSNVSHNLKRDQKETLIYNNALALNIPILGICRGAQFLTVMNGGKLVQDVYPMISGITKSYITTKNGVEEIQIQSDHHQEMFPYNVENYKILGFTFYEAIHKKLSKFENVEKKHLAYNITLQNVFYPETNCLCIQSHPEWLRKDLKDESYSIDYFNRLLESLLSDSDLLYELPELTYSNLKKFIKDNKLNLNKKNKELNNYNFTRRSYLLDKDGFIEKIKEQYEEEKTTNKQPIKTEDEIDF